MNDELPFEPASPDDLPRTNPNLPDGPDGRPRRPVDPGTPSIARSAWLVVILLVGFIAVMQNMPLPAAEEEAEASETAQVEETQATEKATAAKPAGPYNGGMLEISAKYAVFTGSLPIGGSEQELVTAIDQLNTFAVGPADEMRIAIVAGELLGADEAIERLEELQDEFDEQTPEDVRKDMAVLLASYRGNPPPLGTKAAEDLAQDHGWFGRLLLSHEMDDDDGYRAQVLGDARNVGVVFLGGLGVAGIAALVGFVLFIIAIVLLATRKLMVRFIRAAPGGSASIETFALFLCGFLALQVVLPLLAVVLEAVPTIGPAMAKQVDLAVWLLLFIPLWPMFRGASREQWKGSIGWNKGAGVFKEIAAGVVGYIALLPLVGIGLVCTLILMAIGAALSSAEGPVAPSHPLPDQLAAGGIWTYIKLAMLATVWAPLVEESVFRGALYNQLRTTMGFVPSSLIVGFMFAVIHPQGWMAIPVLMSMGAVFCLLREWRGTLIAPAAAHALNNGLVVTMLIVAFNV